jgi:hypothetical protein
MEQRAISIHKTGLSAGFALVAAARRNKPARSCAALRGNFD